VAAHSFLLVVGSIHVVVGDLHDLSLVVERVHESARSGLANGTRCVDAAGFLLALEASFLGVVVVVLII